MGDNETSSVAEPQTEPIVFDSRICGLGEGPLWHPERQALFWVDIPNSLLLGRSSSQEYSWPFDEMLSALGWIDHDHLLVATETGLYKFNIDTGASAQICEIEADNTVTRSNDGRADPWGGFWVGTMGKQAEERAGKIYRWCNGELREIADGITISNGICFDSERSVAYYADTAQYKMWRLSVDEKTGWPVGEPEVFLDFSGDKTAMDGAVVDQSGCLWIAIFDGGCVMRVSPEGRVMEKTPTGTPRPTCPAFGGEQMRDLIVTTASWGLDEMPIKAIPHGSTLTIPNYVQGVSPPRVRLTR